MDTLTSLLERNAEAALAKVNHAPLAKRAVLLTGATGLIGQNLAAALRKAGAKVVTPGRTLPTISGSYDYIIHAAGYAQPAKFMADPMGTIAVNTTMLMDLLQRLSPSGRLLYISTSEVYSGSTRSMHNENDIGTTNPAGARAAYIESKRCGEAICHAARLAGKHTIIARVSSVYGPGVKPKDTRVLSQFIDAALNDGEIVLKDGGTARRVFLYVSDAVEMLLNLLLHGECPIYNVGGPGQAGTSHDYGNINGATAILTLARKVGELMKVPVKMPGGQKFAYQTRIGGSGVPGAPDHVAVDISRYLREMGDKAFVPLDEGLKHTIAWHRMLAGEKVGVAA
jgi:nucleoside-diphosphate-sugar epimerase